MKNNSNEHKISEQLEQLKKQVKEQQEQITLLEQKLNKPTYELHSSLAGQESSTKHHKNKRIFRLHYIPLTLISLISLSVGYWFLNSLWYSGLYQILFLFYATALCTLGIALKKISIRLIGYICYITALILIIISYKCNHLLHPQTSIILHSIIASIFITLIIIRIALKTIYSNLKHSERTVLPVLLDTALALIIFVWGAAVIILYFDKVSGQPSFFMKPFIEYSRAYDTLTRTPLTQFLLTLYYMLFGCSLVLLSSYFKRKPLCIFGLFSIILSAYSSLLMVKSGQKFYVSIIAILWIIIGILGIYFYKKIRKEIGGGGWI